MTRETNKETELARQLIENTGVNVFLTGRAGTGKTTFLKQLCASSNKRMVVLAPTGIAAINAGGMTIHSFFQLPFSPYVPGTVIQSLGRRYDRFAKEKRRLIRTLDMIVIDEISMVRADLLDAVDASLRRHRNPRLPFGGVQLLLIGDLGQLAPVVKPDEWELLSPHYDTPYFFSSLALKEAGYQMVELTHVYRQRDRHFLELLNRVRSNTADTGTLVELNRRYIPDFEPDDAEGYVRLTTHNDRARAINRERLDALITPEVTYDAIVKGDFPESSFPADEYLTLKEGARVMFLRNDSTVGYFNGMLGRIVSLNDNNIEVMPDGGTETLTVEPVVWENTKYSLDRKSGNIVENVIGTFAQYPLRTAWAITIHKSQGLTFERAIINASSSFAHGQTYVALSRCRTLEGLVLDAPLTARAIISDVNVVNYVNSQRASTITEDAVTALTRAYGLHLLDLMLGFEDLRRVFDMLRRIVDEYMSRTFPRLAGRYAIADKLLADDMEKVATTFSALYHSQGCVSDSLAERIKGACGYFGEKIESLVALLRDTPEETDNKDVTRRLLDALDAVKECVNIKRYLFKTFAVENFDSRRYQEVYARALLAIDNPAAAKKKASSKGDTSSRRKPTDKVPDDVINPALYLRLVAWRRELAAQLSVPAYVIISNRSIVEISNSMPLTMSELKKIPGIGDVKARNYGTKILQLVVNGDESD